MAAKRGMYLEWRELRRTSDDDFDKHDLMLVMPNGHELYIGCAMRYITKPRKKETETWAACFALGGSKWFGKTKARANMGNSITMGKWSLARAKRAVEIRAIKTISELQIFPLELGVR